jgi:hypothetical protein
MGFALAVENQGREWFRKPIFKVFLLLTWTQECPVFVTGLLTDP